MPWLEFETIINYLKIQKKMYNNQEELDRLVETVSRAGVDIAPGYSEYVKLAMAIASDCGEMGRSGFITLCSMSAKFNRENAERLFSNALKRGRGDVHLGTAFHLAKMAGVTVEHEEPQESKKGAKDAKGACTHSLTHAHVYNVEDDDNLDVEPDEQSDPRVHLPYFTDKHKWPSLLERIISFGQSREQRDVLLLGGITAIGATLARPLSMLYGSREIHPCLQTFIVAPPASGKGVLSWLRNFVQPIHEEIRRGVNEEMKRYKTQMAAYNAMGRDKAGKEEPEMPLNRMFIFSGNNTGTGMLQNIIDSDGVGIICETEADTLSNSIAAEHGHWSELIRSAFDHDPLSYNRRMDREYREVSSSFLSLLISGTPGQVRPLIPSSENGLFSRQLFYYMSRIPQWEDQFRRQKGDGATEFRKMGREWIVRLRDIERLGNISLKLSESQIDRFNELFNRLFDRSKCYTANEMNSSVIRLAINIGRMMMVVGLLRLADRCGECGNFMENLRMSSMLSPNGGINNENVRDGLISSWELSISDDDFNATLALAEPLYLHAVHILSFLPANEVKNRGMVDKERLISSLNNNFTTQELKDRAADMNISINTWKSWLRRWQQQGIVKRCNERGVYLKN